MQSPKKEHPVQKSSLHPRNKHRERYDFEKLTESCPELTTYVALNVYGDQTIDFFNPDAVICLNKALLKHAYDIENWEIPAAYLCPPIPGRADYIHHMADLLREGNYGKIPSGSAIKCLDIGTGANCIYPIIGIKEYGWKFVGSEIDPVALESAERIRTSNPGLEAKLELRFQPNPTDVLKGIIRLNEHFDLTICNPPFHASAAEAREGTLRKLSKLKGEKINEVQLNFGGQSSELWCEGGEIKFIQTLIRQSKKCAVSCFWFSSLVSKQSNLKQVYELLRIADASEVKTIPMSQGNKSSRIVAWTFLNKEQQKAWVNTNWNVKT